ncbi:unnamed protein product [Darwinula stevensoni]|uniref:C-type lectin domain-containing protein n=1 Tax=Darwinula stevensoni TaxID=69355 RepID=A0A7R9A5M5_9CRUS|nr:unnamed protein product [Darwinula stevensoni]CAG0892379.1 unnamed protein product [Darwinula stevensoni]
MEHTNEDMTHMHQEQVVHGVRGFKSLKRELTHFEGKIKHLEDYMRFINGIAWSEEAAKETMSRSTVKMPTNFGEITQGKLGDVDHLVNGMESLIRDMNQFSRKVDLMEESVTSMNPYEYECMIHADYACLFMNGDFESTSNTHEIHVHSKGEPFTDGMPNVPTTQQTLLVTKGRSYEVIQFHSYPSFHFYPRLTLNPTSQSCIIGPKCVEGALNEKFLDEAPCAPPSLVPLGVSSLKPPCNTTDDFGLFLDFHDVIKNNFTPGCLRKCNTTVYDAIIVPDGFVPMFDQYRDRNKSDEEISLRRPGLTTLEFEVQEFFATENRYTPVPGTSSFLKLVRIDGITWIQAKAECSLDVGSRLAIPATTEMLNSMNQTMIAVLGLDIACKYFFMDGQSTTNQYTWSFSDGTGLNITAKGEGNFHPYEPDSGSGGQCLMMTRQYALVPLYSGFLVDSSCTSGVVQFGCVSDGYFCEIKIPN